MQIEVRNKEISWLAFNARVLQEAADPAVPLVDRLTFLGIFSSNLDEFFRVRVATLRRLALLGKPGVKIVGEDPDRVLRRIHEIVIAQQARFGDIYGNILEELARNGILIVRENELDGRQQDFLWDFFHQQLRPVLVPIMINHLSRFPELRDEAIYLAVSLSSERSKKSEYALIEVPTQVFSRFLLLPSPTDRRYVILLDDVIRHCLKEIFSILPFDRFEAYTIKLTRDAQLDLDDTLSESYIEKISKSLKQRKYGRPVRFIYDRQIPPRLLKFLLRKMHLKLQDESLIPGGRYHNFKDFMNFPKIGPQHLYTRPIVPVPHRRIASSPSFFKAIREEDVLLHYPYQSFDYLLEFLRQAAIDPKVASIKITLYRVARNSKVINALINASRNGKEVTVVMELQARFDEADNVYWAERLQEEGVRVIDSVPGLKVHAKLILISRVSHRKTQLYATVSTGNFNESTGRIYSDHSLFTSDKRITEEVKTVFAFFENNYKRERFKHLLVSPYDTRRKLYKLIDRESTNARKGREAYIIVKLNNLEDRRMIAKLYEASQAGVKIRLMVRGMFSLIPGVKGMSENIEARTLVDKFLEHSRLLVFCNGGKEQIFLCSGDWMPRNLDHRVEVACPIYDEGLRREIKNFLDIQWQDNVKSRILDRNLTNTYNRNGGSQRLRAQLKIYDYLWEQNSPTNNREEPEALAAYSAGGHDERRTVLAKTFSGMERE